jgi:putative transcriptional regulator
MSIPDKVVAGLKEALANVESKSGGRSYKVRLHSPGEIQKLRNRLGMTQKDFAEQFGVSFQTVQKWEQGTRKPEGAANSFLAVIEKIPNEVIAALRAHRAERVTSGEDVGEATSAKDVPEATSREAWRKGWHDPRYSREQHEAWGVAWHDPRYCRKYEDACDATSVTSGEDVREVMYQLLMMGRLTTWRISREDVRGDLYRRWLKDPEGTRTLVVEALTRSNADETRKAIDHALVRLNALVNAPLHE